MPNNLGTESEPENVSGRESNLDTKPLFTPELVEGSNSESLKWSDDLIVLNHRSKNQRLEYLVKHRLDPVSLAFWQKVVDLKDHPMINEYLQNLQKPITHSRTKALVSNLTIPSEGTNGTENTINIHNFPMV